MGDDRKHDTGANGVSPEPPRGTPAEVARAAWVLAMAAENHGLELHASFIRFAAGVQQSVEALRRDMTAAFRAQGVHIPDSRELPDDTREKMPSRNDLERFAEAAQDLQDALEEATSPGFIPPPRMDSDRVKAMAVEVVEHHLTAAELRDHRESSARWWKAAFAIAGSALVGAATVIWYLLTHR